MARQAVELMDEKNPVAEEDNACAKRLERLFGRHKNEDGLDLNYKVYLVEDINAFAAADGSIRVFAGLMDAMDDEEVLSVIGHEIGHIKLHHTRNAVREAYKRAAVAEAVSSRSEVVGKLSDSELGSFADALLGNKFSRKQEADADAYGYEFLKRNGYNVMGMVRVFNRLADLSGGGELSRTQKMMSSHPGSRDRANKAEERARQDDLYVEEEK